MTYENHQQDMFNVEVWHPCVSSVDYSKITGKQIMLNILEEVIETSYKEMENDTSKFQVNFYCDTEEDEVEEVDVEAEEREYEEMKKLIEEHRRLKEREVA